MAPFTLLAGITTYIWPFAITKHSLIVIAALYGQICFFVIYFIFADFFQFQVCAYISLINVPTIAVGEIEDVGRRGTRYQ